jgi:hypothetical protein
MSMLDSAYGRGPDQREGCDVALRKVTGGWHAECLEQRLGARVLGVVAVRQWWDVPSRALGRSTSVCASVLQGRSGPQCSPRTSPVFCIDTALTMGQHSLCTMLEVAFATLWYTSFWYTSSWKLIPPVDKLDINSASKCRRLSRTTASCCS